MIISYQYFLKNVSDYHYAYLNDLGKGFYITNGGISTDGDILGGSFKMENGSFFGYYTIKEYTNDPDLESKHIMLIKQIERVKYRASNYKEYFVNMVQEIFPSKDKNFLTYAQYKAIENFMGDSFVMDEYISPLIEKELKNPDYNIFPSFETPFELKIYSTDNMTYVKFFEKDFDMVKYLEKFNHIDITEKLLNEEFHILA